MAPRFKPLSFKPSAGPGPAERVTKYAPLVDWLIENPCEWAEITDAGAQHGSIYDAIRSTAFKRHNGALVEVRRHEGVLYARYVPPTQGES